MAKRIALQSALGMQVCSHTRPHLTMIDKAPNLRQPPTQSMCESTRVSHRQGGECSGHGQASEDGNCSCSAQHINRAQPNNGGGAEPTHGVTRIAGAKAYAAKLATSPTTMVSMPAHHSGSRRYEKPPEPATQQQQGEGWRLHLWMVEGRHPSRQCKGRDLMLFLCPAQQTDRPALTPELPALRRPFFFIMKLLPMKMEELMASSRPLLWSDSPSGARLSVATWFMMRSGSLQQCYEQSVLAGHDASSIAAATVRWIANGTPRIVCANRLVSWWREGSTQAYSTDSNTFQIAHVFSRIFGVQVSFPSSTSSPGPLFCVSISLLSWWSRGLCQEPAAAWQHGWRGAAAQEGRLQGLQAHRPGQPSFDQGQGELCGQGTRTLSKACPPCQPGVAGYGVKDRLLASHAGHCWL